LGFFLAISHLANEDPDQPEPSREARQYDVHEKVQATVFLVHDGSFRRMGFSLGAV
jgi:hypothetical protein